MECTKEFKERDELLRQLEADGLAIPDRVEALNFLTRVGYFRSGAYRYVFRQLLPSDKVNERLRQYRQDQYIPGASIKHVMQLEAFDFKLSRVCLEGLLDFEVRLRAAIAHTLAVKDVAAHSLIRCLDADACGKPSGEQTKFDAWMETCRETVRSGSEDEDFIAHHLLKYPNQPMPIWALTEVLSFGKLPYLFELMQTPDAREVARMFGFAHPRPFGAVLRMMVDFRNTCAHGSRLYNRAFKRPLSIRAHETVGSSLAHLITPDFTATPKQNQRLYIYAATLAFMLMSHSSGSGWNMTFKTQVKKLNVELEAPDGSMLVSPEVSMGFPRNWMDLDLWQPRRQ
ncbi:Abi family protein [Arthrobacter rhombi]|uniref:Abi family protein n=1 Tax=Arthrobacter rhombi TaxID=71253 RepID=UPI003FCEF9DD